MKKSYNIAEKHSRDAKTTFKKLKKEYITIDRKKNVANIYWIIFKRLLENKKARTWDIAKEFFHDKLKPSKWGKTSVIPASYVVELWSYLRLLERKGFILIKREEKGRKRSEIGITHRFYYALLYKFYLEIFNLVDLDTPKRIVEVFPYFSQIPPSKLISKKDIESFLTGKTQETPLSKAVKRIWVLTSIISKVVEVLRKGFYEELIEKNKTRRDKVETSLLILAKEILAKDVKNFEPDRELVKKAKKELKELGWDVEKIEASVEKYKRILIKSYVVPMLKKSKRLYNKRWDELIQKAKRGEWDSDYKTSPYYLED